MDARSKILCRHPLSTSITANMGTVDKTKLTSASDHPGHAEKAHINVKLVISITPPNTTYSLFTVPPSAHARNLCFLALVSAHSFSALGVANRHITHTETPPHEVRVSVFLPASHVCCSLSATLL